MSIYTRITVWAEGQILTANDLNVEFNNDILNGPTNHASQHASGGVDDIKAYFLSLSAGGTVAGATTFSAAAGTVALSCKLNEYKGADIASGATTDIGAATGNLIDVTGTATITALGTIQAGTERIVRFTSTPTLTHNGTSLILPGAANIVCQANDIAMFRSLGSGNWVCTSYQRAVNPPYVQSATPAANTVPVRRSASPYAIDVAELAMTGEASAKVITNTDPSINLGSVTNGDRIDVLACVSDSYSVGPTFQLITMSKASGTATVQWLSDIATIGNPSYFSTSPTFGHIRSVLQVTGSGTLVIQATITTNGGTLTAYNRQLYAFFLKKQ